MRHTFTLSLAAMAFVASAASAQDGPLRRIGRGLDQTGRNIRATVEDEVARGEITAKEREVLNRVGKRIDWDKKMAGSTFSLEVQPGGVVILRGSVLSEPTKLRAVDLVENTSGVTRVVDELAVVKNVRVIDARPAASVIEVAPAETQVIVPPQTKVIVKP